MSTTMTQTAQAPSHTKKRFVAQAIESDYSHHPSELVSGGVCRIPSLRVVHQANRIVRKSVSTPVLKT